jgi:hypothetical protein
MNFEKLERVLTTILLKNPSALHIVKSDQNRLERIQYLAHFMLKRGIRKKGLFVSDDGAGLAICYRVAAGEKKTIRDRFEELLIGFKVIGYFRIPGILKRQAYLKSQLPKNEPYYYFWFFGVAEGSRGNDTGTSHELKRRVFEQAEHDGLPIYAETSTRKNKIVYQRYGFEVFHEWKINSKTTMWFMKKPVSPFN